MEYVKISLDDQEFDNAVHGPKEGQPSLPEGGDMAIYVKVNATVNGNAMAVITFTVQLPDGTLRRAQCPTTVVNPMTAFGILKGWQESGQLNP